MTDDDTQTPASHDEPNADVATLPYERARDELVAIVQRLEGGSAPLEQTLQLWERGEALAGRCRGILDAAQARLDRASAAESATPRPGDAKNEDAGPASHGA